MISFVNGINKAIRATSNAVSMDIVVSCQWMWRSECYIVHTGIEDYYLIHTFLALFAHVRFCKYYLIIFAKTLLNTIIITEEETSKDKSIFNYTMAKQSL